MNVLVGDNTGLLKHVSLRTNGTIKKMGVQESARGGINAMCWAGLHNRESEVAIALSGGNIEVWNPATQSRVAMLQGVYNSDEEAKYAGLHTLCYPTNDVVKRRIINVLSNGKASIIPWLDNQIGELELDDEDAQFENLTESQKNNLKRKLATEHAKKLREQEDFIASETVEWSLGRHIERTRLAPSNEILVSGGKNNKVSLFDIETQTQIFRAKNLANDWLNMQVPNWDMDFCFLTSGCQEPWTNSGKVDYRIAVSTGYHNVRIYDVKASRRPIEDVSIGAHPARSIVNSNCGNYVIVGDAAGRIQKLDVRVNLRQVGVFKGNCGSIREIQMHPTLPMIASVGLDRHLRIHDMDTRKLLKEVYLTQKLTGCLFSALEPSKKLARSVVSDTINNKEEEDAWEELEKLSKKNTVQVQNNKVLKMSSRKEVEEKDDEEEEEEDEDFDEEDYEEFEIEEEVEHVASNNKDKSNVVVNNKKKEVIVTTMVDLSEDEEDMDEDNMFEGDEDNMFEGDEDMFDLEEDEDDDLLYGDEDEDDEFEPFTVSFKLLGDDKVVSSGSANNAVPAPVPVKPVVKATPVPVKPVVKAAPVPVKPVTKAAVTTKATTQPQVTKKPATAQVPQPNQKKQRK